MKSFTALALLAATASALQITEPTLGAQWDFSQTNTITWQSVATDPSNFTIVLVDNASSPPTQMTVATDVNTTAGDYSLTNFVAPPGGQYIFEFISTSMLNSGILCQSPDFNVTKSGVAATTTSSSASGTASATASASASHTNAAIAMGPTFGVAAPLAAVFAMLL